MNEVDDVQAKEKRSDQYDSKIPIDKDVSSVVPPAVSSGWNLFGPYRQCEFNMPIF